MRLKRGCSGAWIALAAIAIDRVCKQAALACLAPSGVKTAIPGLLSWAYTENSGVAFGLLSGRGALLILLTLALIALITLYLIRKPDEPAAVRAGLWLIVGGGIGNLYDRIVYGRVVDFIRPDFVDFAVFNPADIFVCAGAIWVVVAMVVCDVRRRRNHG